MKMQISSNKAIFPQNIKKAKKYRGFRYSKDRDKIEAEKNTN